MQFKKINSELRKKWEIASYIIEAKKIVDSIWYISDNLDNLSNINLMEIQDKKLQTFYINCRTAIDKFFTKSEKKKLYDGDETIKAMLYEANKNFAHKDDDYVMKEYTSWKELLNLLKKQILHLKTFLKPLENITLDFVPHDSFLYRFVNKIDPNKEEEIKRKRFPFYKREDLFNGYEKKTIIPLNNIQESKGPGFLKKDAVLLKLGLNISEDLQEIQDSMTRFNFLYGQDLWISKKYLLSSCIEFFED